MPDTNTAYFAASNSNGFSNDEAVGEVCIANISPYERRKRLKFSVVQFVVTLIVLGVLIILGIHPLWRLMLFFLFSASTSSFFQSRDKT